MATLKFDPDNTLAGGLFGISPRETIALGVRLCAAVEQAVGADGSHGGVWPGNITWTDGQVAVGPVNDKSIAEMAPEVLEFVSPEQFWDGTGSPASDVYSIGLVLYTALNRGVMPYFKKAEDNGPEERAQALQSRMKGEKLEYPAAAGRALGDVVLKAASFRAEDRYATPGQLRAALEALPEGSELAAAVPVVPLSEKERQRAPSYKVDKEFETPMPSKRKKGRGAAKKQRSASRPNVNDAPKTETVTPGPSGGAEAGPAPAPPTPVPPAEQEDVMEETMVYAPAKPETPEPEPKPEPEPEKAEAPSSEETPGETKPPEVVEEPKVEAPTAGKKPKRRAGEVDENMDAREFRGEKPKKGNQGAQLIFLLLLLAVVVVALILLLKGCREDDTFLPESEATVTPSQELIHPPVEETPPSWQHTPEPTHGGEAPAQRYELVRADVSWTEARELAERSGGRLGAVRNGLELREIISLAEEQGIQFVWLGASRSSGDGAWYYVDGEPMDFADWDTGRPSAAGGDYLLLRYRPAPGYWSYSDQVDDPVSLLPESYSGRIGYVIERE